MAKKDSIKMNLPAADSLFTTQEERDEAKRESVMNISIEEISDFPEHPFKVRMDESMMEMVESVKQYGVLVPAIVREKAEGGYEMIAGHRRRMASELAGEKEMPCFVRDLTDDESIVIMVDSNLQREKVLPSEKAFAYKMKLEAMKRQQGYRSDLTSVPVGQKLGQTSREILASKSPDSNTQIQRYIRLTELIPPILDMVDEEKIAMRPAVEISYLPKTEQEILLDTMQLQDCTPSYAQAIKMRKFSEEGKLDENVLLSILSEEKGNQKERFSMPRERISKFFSAGTPKEKIEDTIVKALELYRKRERSKEKER